MVKAAPPDDAAEGRLAVGSPKRWAAGIPGVLASVRALNDQLGIRKAARTMLRINQFDGFDCPGCAWPEPHETSRLEFCENGAKAVAEEATDRRVTAEFFAAHSIDDLSDRSDHWLGQQGRLTEPMHRAAGEDHYRPIAWSDAIALVADRLQSLASPDRAVFYTSGRTSNEAAFLYQLFARAFGTNNLPDCSNMCHESSGVALGQTIGIGKGTVTLDDIYAAELIIVAGQNPGTNHPRMLGALEQAKRNGAAIVSINPLPEAGLISFHNPKRLRGVVGHGTALADLHVPVAVAADLALFQWVNRRLVARGAVDQRFIDDHCDGFAELVAHLESVDEAALLAATGIDVTRGRGACRSCRCRRTGSSCAGRWDSLSTAKPWRRSARSSTRCCCVVRSVAVAPGCARCAGTATSRATARWASSNGRPMHLLDALATRFSFDPPRHHGYDTVATIEAMAAGAVDVFVGLGGNFAAAAPDTVATAAALQRCALTVQVSTKLNRSHVRCGAEALILPCLGRTEADRGPAGDRFVTVEDSMGIVHASRGANEPASPQLRSEVEIVCSLAAATLGARPIDWQASRPTTTAFASTSRRRSRGSPTSTPGSAGPAASRCPTRPVTAPRSRRSRAGPACR